MTPKCYGDSQHRTYACIKLAYNQQASLNVGKSNVLIFKGKYTTTPAINISIDRTLVEEKDNAKYLCLY